MNRRSFFRFLAGVPVLGYFLSTETSAQSVISQPEPIIKWKTLPDDLPDHFPKNIVIIDAEGLAHPVPVVVTDGFDKYPDEFCVVEQTPNQTTFKIKLPLVVVSKDGRMVMCFCYLDEDFNQITEQLISHYNMQIDEIADNRPTIQAKAWPRLRIMKWKMYLKPSTDKVPRTQSH